MAKCISYQNTEYLVLQDFMCELSTAISADLTLVVLKLFSNRVITQTQLQEAQLQTRTKQERANELVTQVIAQVRINSEKFDHFIKALEECGVCQKEVKDLREKYKKNKTSQV